MPSQPPDNAPVFAALCPDLAAAGATSGQVRVAVVVDAGYAADAPTGQTPPGDVVSCVTVPEGSTGNQALAAAGAVTDDGGLICSINGYPEGECGNEVSDADAAAAATAAKDEQPNPAVVAAAGTTTDDSHHDSRFGQHLVGRVRVRRPGPGPAHRAGVLDPQASARSPVGRVGPRHGPAHHDPTRPRARGRDDRTAAPQPASARVVGLGARAPGRRIAHDQPAAPRADPGLPGGRRLRASTRCGVGRCLLGGPAPGSGGGRRTHAAPGPARRARGPDRRVHPPGDRPARLDGRGPPRRTRHLGVGADRRDRGPSPRGDDRVRGGGELPDAPEPLAEVGACRPVRGGRGRGRGADVRPAPARRCPSGQLGPAPARA